MSHINLTLARVEDALNKYKIEHQGQAPLYIFVSSEDAGKLWEEISRTQGHPSDAIITSFKGSKIVKNETLNKGEIQLTDELPETGS
ncbi:MAG: hypothetical protein ACOYXT_04615 [Bacteroidota bacterium]